MKTLATFLSISFLFATLFLSFTLAACGTADTPICSSIFGMNNKACEANPIEHHIAITEQPTLCTLDSIVNAAALSSIIMVILAIMAAILPSHIVTITASINERLLRLFHIMNPFDTLRLAFANGTIQQRKNVRAV